MPAVNQQPLSPQAPPEALTQIDVAQLKILRSDRYDGSGFSTTLSALLPSDAAVIARVYQALRLICDVVLYMGDQRDSDILLRLLRSQRDDLSQIRKLGKEPAARPAGLQNIFHDLRAGALSALYGYLEMLEDGEGFTETDLQQCLILAFDHAKMMRNAVEDLDPWVHLADERLSLHSVEDQIARWKNTRFRLNERAIQLLCTSHSSGIMSNRCLETSSIDRIAYNLMNNAARFSAAEAITLSVEDVSADLLRFVVSNQVNDEQVGWLQQNVGNDLNALWNGGLTHKGHGRGLRNCAELITRCFGLVASQDAADDGYLGLTLEGNIFSAWFHWPLYHPQPGDPVCHC